MARRKSRRKQVGYTHRQLRSGSWQFRVSMENRFVAYFRVSTARQGQSGLGLDAQRAAVEAFARSRSGVVLTAFTEVETGKGANALERRPELCLALAECKRQKAVLVIAKLDRLSRGVHFVSGLMESRVRFVACDLAEANELTIHIGPRLLSMKRSGSASGPRTPLPSQRPVVSS